MYKIKKLLPLKARLQIYHRIFQSHIKFCSLVWGFSCKSNIEAIFCKQEKGLRVVMPGFINCNYKDGIIPGHTMTKQYFNEYIILTIHNIISLNTTKLNCSNNTHFSPEHRLTHDDCEKWLKIYNSPTYRNSLLYYTAILLNIPILSELQLQT